MPDPNQYTIGWICAIVTEFVAAQTFLDEEHEEPDYVSRHDNNVYALGSIKKHNVVIAVLPSGEYGTSSAASVARDMLHTFPNIRIGLMVGVGGGAPSPKHDVRLGDIVVSAPQDGKGGVFQYDFGKTIQEQSFQYTGFLNQPPTILRTATNALNAKYIRHGSQLDKAIRIALENNPNLMEYRRPEAVKDNLYRAEIVHSDEGCCSTPASVDQSKLVRRPPRTKNINDPTIHYGLVASANSLMKDALVRDRLAEEKDVLCFEMEAAGLMNHFPCLVIRGICDYSDTHKNKEWQNYAAMAAAAYAKDLICRIAPNKVEAETKIAEAINDLNNQIKGVQSLASQAKVGVESLEAHNYVKGLRNWLSPPDPSTNFQKALDQRHQGSGQWLLGREDYTTWKEEQNSFLWLSGIPGCGKTILSATVVEELGLSKTCSQALLYFYFDFNETTKQSFENAIRSLIIQLYFKCEPARLCLDSIYTTDCKDGNLQPSIDSLREAFFNMAEKAGEVWIILDALDECGAKKEQQRLLKWIGGLRRSQTTGNIHLLATSRWEPDIESAMENMARKPDKIHIQSSLIEEDICAYVRAKVRESPGLRRWRSNPAVQGEIEDTLIKKANGMFRWVACQFDDLEDCFDPPTVRRALASLPKTLNETYARILTKIPETYEHYTKRVLQFLLFSARPLSINEVVDAVAVDTEKGIFDPDNRMPNPMEVPKCCSSLVVVVPGKYDEEVIQLAHFSVKEFLLSYRLEKNIATYLEPVTARTSIAKVCLTYLLQLDHSLTSEQIKERYYLAWYAAHCWMSHAAVAESEVCTLATQLFSCSGAYEACVQLFTPDIVWWKCKHPQKPSPLYYASFGGLSYITRTLIENGADINAQGGPYHWTALYSASRRGDEEMVKMLLDNNADVNVKAKEGSTALCIASSQGHEKIVQMLLSRNPDIHVKNEKGRTALFVAQQRKHDKIVQMLLNQGAIADQDTIIGTSSPISNSKTGLFSTIGSKSGTCSSDNSQNSLSTDESSLFSVVNSNKSSFSVNSESGQEQNVSGELGVEISKAKDESTPKSLAEASKPSSQEEMPPKTPTFTAPPRPQVGPLADPTIEQPQRPPIQSTPDVTPLAPLPGSAGYRGKRKRKADETDHYDPQSIHEPEKPGTRRRRADQQETPASRGIPYATALVSLTTGAVSSGKKKRKADETYHNGSQIPSKPEKSRARRSRVYTRERGPRTHHMKLRSIG